VEVAVASVEATAAAVGVEVSVEELVSVAHQVAALLATSSTFLTFVSDLSSLRFDMTNASSFHTLSVGRI
jgi:hypothetical protein